ncbi:MAG TPA: hypothetical protein VGQ30_13790 [Gemmatimonadaceae bacterium]|jgi:hypothetical protein|nr:hypothetical protein [Gemmatimonadaceae bacterium]
MKHDTPEENSPELEAELRAIARAAAGLPELAPSRDLWSGIAARIEAPVVALPTSAAPAAPQRAALPWRRLAIAASLLVVTTAGITYTIVRRNNAAELAANNDSLSVAVPVSSAPVEPVSTLTAEQTFDREISALRKIVDERRKELDPATAAVLDKNLKVIDAAIAESKAALAKDPASAFLMDMLTHAYDSKLQLMRGVANIPSRG